MIVGLEISDEVVYENYRKEMKPILSQYGGGFRYDFKILETLKSESKNPINRIFAIFFESEDAKNDFFGNIDYLKIKRKYFEKSVVNTTIISEYKRDI